MTMTYLRHEKDESIKGNIIKDVNGAIKDRVIRDIRNHFEHEEENYYKQ